MSPDMTFAPAPTDLTGRTYEDFIYTGVYFGFFIVVLSRPSCQHCRARESCGSIIPVLASSC